MVDSSNNTSFSKTICSICYEDLKPIVEDLQSISICGHVFHELCLQQWFEYCTNTKKPTCPVCKQGCAKKDVGRLYFQSLGDNVVSQCQSENPRIHCDDGYSPEILHVEVKRLESKVSNLNCALDLQQKEVKHLTDQLHICKDQLSKEVILKNDALRQRESIQAILQTKSNDLVRSTTECSKLQELNKSLFKELAAIKLASDCNLEEEEIVKLASVGHDGNIQDAIDVLKKSLVIRNKSYKELMAKCNSLGRGEDRYRRKHEKSKEKIVKLKARVQELDTAIEAKDNEVLRLLKASKKRSCNEIPIVNKCINSSSVLKHSSLGDKGLFSTPVINLDDDDDISPSEAKKTSKSYTPFEGILDEERELKNTSVDDAYTNFLSGKDDTLQKCGSSKAADSSFVENASQANQQFGSSTLSGLSSVVVNEGSVSKEASGLLLQNIRQIQPSAHTTPEASSFIPLVEPGDRCFAGGLLGPDGANRYLGKWCKRVQNNSPKGAAHGSSIGTDSLISVGADGRGGKVKVLKSLNQTNIDTKESMVSAKRLKTGGKSSSFQAQGCRQIEHFFGKARS